MADYRSIHTGKAVDDAVSNSGTVENRVTALEEKVDILEGYAGDLITVKAGVGIEIVETENEQNLGSSEPAYEKTFNVVGVKTHIGVNSTEEDSYFPLKFTKCTQTQYDDLKYPDAETLYIIIGG